MAAVRKRDLLETLANDDPSAFGYDKGPYINDFS